MIFTSFNKRKIHAGKYLALLLLFAMPNIYALEMTIIPLANARAEQLLPVIEQQLDEGSSASIYQNQIILNATAEEITKIRDLIKKLDIAGQQLRITIKIGNNDSSTSNTSSINNNTLNNNGLSISKKSRLGNTTTVIQRHSSNASGASSQGILATEGQPAYISTGSSTSYNQPTITANGNIVQTKEWKSAQTGFWATVWLNGNSVNIDLEQQKENLNQDNFIDSQQLQTHINGRLGDWIAIGTLHSQDKQHSYTLNSIENTTANNTNTIYLKVDRAE